MPPKKGVGGLISGRSNGLNADGSLMNVGNKLGSRPSIRLFNQYSAGTAMQAALTDEGMGYEPGEARMPLEKYRPRSAKISQVAAAVGF
eukprot:SAG11_NODE_2488_length_3295_cov_4.463079_3_plen_89_part_00